MATAQEQWAQDFTRSISALLYQIEHLEGLTAQYTSQGWGQENLCTEDELASIMAGLDNYALVGGVVSVEALKTFLGQGHATNLYRLMRRQG